MMKTLCSLSCLAAVLFLGGCRASDSQSPPTTDVAASGGGGVVADAGLAAGSAPAAGPTLDDIIAAILANSAGGDEEWKIVNDDPGCCTPGDEWYEEMYREHSGKPLTLANLLRSLTIEQARERPQVWEVSMALRMFCVASNRPDGLAPLILACYEKNSRPDIRLECVGTLLGIDREKALELARDMLKNPNTGPEILVHLEETLRFARAVDGYPILWDRLTSPDLYQNMSMMYVGLDFYRRHTGETCGDPPRTIDVDAVIREAWRVAHAMLADIKRAEESKPKMAQLGGGGNTFVARTSERQQELQACREQYPVVSGNAATLANFLKSLAIMAVSDDQRTEVLAALRLIVADGIDPGGDITSGEIVAAIQTCYKNNLDWPIRIQCVLALVRVDREKGLYLAQGGILQGFNTDVKADMETRLLLAKEFLDAGELTGYLCIKDGLISPDGRLRTMAFDLLNRYGSHNGTSYGLHRDEKINIAATLRQARADARELVKALDAVAREQAAIALFGKEAKKTVQQRRQMESTYKCACGDEPVMANFMKSLAGEISNSLGELMVVAALWLIVDSMSADGEFPGGVSREDVIGAVLACYERNSAWFVRLQCVDAMLRIDRPRGVELALGLLAADSEAGLEVKLLLARDLRTVGVLDGYAILDEALVSPNALHRREALNLLHWFRPHDGAAYGDPARKIDIAATLEKARQAIQNRQDAGDIHPTKMQSP